MPAVVAVLLAALCFSTTGTAQALAGVDASPVAIGAARIAIGGGLLGLVGLLGRRGPDPLPHTGSGRAWPAITVGGIGVLAYQPAFFLGTRTNGVAVGTLIALGSAPIATGVLQAVVARRPPARRWTVATAIALVGITLLSGVLDGGVDAVQPLGVAASLVAGVSYAAYAVSSKTLLDRGWPPVRAIGAIFGTAGACSIPVLLVAGTAWLVTPQGASLALWLGVVTTAVAYLLFVLGLRRLQATTVSTLTLAEPLAATVLGLAVLHERLPGSALAGAAVVAVGLAVLNIPVRARTAGTAVGG